MLRGGPPLAGNRAISFAPRPAVGGAFAAIASRENTMPCDSQIGPDAVRVPSIPDRAPLPGSTFTRLLSYDGALSTWTATIRVPDGSHAAPMNPGPPGELSTRDVSATSSHSS